MADYDKTEEVVGYNPNKKERAVRRNLYERYWAMRDDSLRKEAEADWEIGDKALRLWSPTPDPDDWRANLVLPDGFSAVQADMQERVERKSRPALERVEDSDKGKEIFGNSILTHNMNRTGFDYQWFLAKYHASVRGTSFLFNYWRTDKRTIKDPTSVEDGQIQYKEKEVIDFDDDYTAWIENEFIFLDPAANHIDRCKDGVRREILAISEFKRIYGSRPDFQDVDKVKPGGDVGKVGFFKMPQDMYADDVEILHYYNRAVDEYNVCANNIVVRMGPLPWKHKELPMVPVCHYIVPGRIWGMGIPKVVNSLSEERTTLRRLNLDRQKMQQNKMFLVSDAIDLDDEDLVTRPFGLIPVATSGLALSQAVQPLEYGDVPASYYRTEEILLEDIRRAHGIDDRIQGVQTGGTATEAAILKESSLKRVNMISVLSEMDPLVRIGRLKWSNIQFFYKAPRIERITKDNEERENKVYRKIRVEGKELTVVVDNEGKKKLEFNDIEGSSSFTLDSSNAEFMEGDWDVTIFVDPMANISKPIKQAKIVEVMNLIAANPLLLSQLDPQKAVQRLLDVNDENPKNWLKSDFKDVKHAQMLAEFENLAMSEGQVLAPTEGATEEHTLVHLNFTETAKFQALPEYIQAAFQAHVMGEHDANPVTGDATDLAQGNPEEAGIPPQGGAGEAGVEVQPADLQASSVIGNE